MGFRANCRRVRWGVGKLEGFGPLGPRVVEGLGPSMN